MKTIKQDKHTEAFEQLLLSYSEMCYSVALALTHNPEDAGDLTREVLICAWHRRDADDATIGIKSQLLTALRKSFLHDYCRSTRIRAKDAASITSGFCVTGSRADDRILEPLQFSHSLSS
jgi:DNA-directed RNA polymerase specialized sigma24 family protein